MRQSFAANRVHRRLHGTNPSHTTASLPVPRHRSETTSVPPAASVPISVPGPQITREQARVRHRIQRQLQTPDPSQPSFHFTHTGPLPRRPGRPPSPDRHHHRRRKRHNGALCEDPYFPPPVPALENLSAEPKPLKRRRNRYNTQARQSEGFLPPSPLRHPAHSSAERQDQLREESRRDSSGSVEPNRVIRIFDENGIDRTAEYRRPVISPGFLNSQRTPVPCSSVEPLSQQHHLNYRNTSSIVAPHNYRPRLRRMSNSVLPADLDSLRHRPDQCIRKPSTDMLPRRSGLISTTIPNIEDSELNDLETKPDFVDLRNLRRNLPTLSELPLPATRQASSTISPVATMFDMTRQDEHSSKRRRTMSLMGNASSPHFSILRLDTHNQTFPLVDVRPDSPIRPDTGVVSHETFNNSTSVLARLPWDPKEASPAIIDVELKLFDKPDLSVFPFIKNIGHPFEPNTARPRCERSPNERCTLGNDNPLEMNENVPPQSPDCEDRLDSFRQRRSGSGDHGVAMAITVPKVIGNPVALASAREVVELD